MMNASQKAGRKIPQRGRQRSDFPHRGRSTVLTQIAVATLLLTMWGGTQVSTRAQTEPHEDVLKLVAEHFGDANPSQPYIPNHQPYIPGFRDDHFARAYLGDGLLGIRPNPNPLSQSETVAAGFVFTNVMGGFEMYAPAPYPLGTDIRVGALSLLKDSDHLAVHRQTLDMNRGSW